MNRENYQIVLDQIIQYPETWNKGMWTRLCCLCFAMLLTATVAYAGVVHQNEWDSKTVPAGWDYNAPPVIDPSANSPSGGGALKFTYQAGTYTTSTGGGRTDYKGLRNFNLTEGYFGHWQKFSPGFMHNPISTKIDYIWASQPQLNLNNGTGVGLFTIRTAFGSTNTGSAYLTIDVTIQGNGLLGPNSVTPHSISTNGATRLDNNRWYWLEYRIKLNGVTCTAGTVACVTPDGELDVWIDDVNQGSWRTLRWRDKADTVLGTFLHSTEWGGGGGTIPDQCPSVTPHTPCPQYSWVDHTVFSTIRIGRPGSAPTHVDTLPPARPIGVVIQ